MTVLYRTCLIVDCHGCIIDPYRASMPGMCLSDVFTLSLLTSSPLHLGFADLQLRVHFLFLLLNQN
jgi:hypothetical protein